MKMKKKLFSCILLAVFACVALFSFAACSSDQNVSDRLDALESDLNALEAKVEALEAANANFQQQLAALDTSSDTFADDLAELTSNYNSLTASVQNATHIERVVVTKEDVEKGHPIVESCLLTLVNTTNRVGISCSINYVDRAPVFQLATCSTLITVDQQTFTEKISLTRADLDTSIKRISGSQVTNIPMTSESTTSKDWTEIIFYTFY